MARYEVTFEPRAEKALSSLESVMQARIRKELDRLADDPRHPGIKKLQGFAVRHRARVGDYRIIYDIFDDQLRVLVLRIGRRDNVDGWAFAVAVSDARPSGPRQTVDSPDPRVLSPRLIRDTDERLA